MPKHPTEAELSAYNLGQLQPEEAAAIEGHISDCRPCCETIISLTTDDTFVGLLKEAKQLPERTVAHDVQTASAAPAEVPNALADHPRYEVVELAGRGGMGDVFKARHRMMERTVALKIINRELMRNPEAVDRFHREVKAAAQLAHPNIVTAYDAEQADGVHYLVMEFVDGIDLSRVVRERGVLSVKDACDYVRQAADGLQHAHEEGMVHRDIKPHNLMVTGDGTLKILDFGLASLAAEPVSDGGTVAARGDLTAVGAIMGTPDFISPEQAEDARQVDIRSDIYSLGATLYFLLSGQPPFSEGSVMDKLKSHAQAEAKPLSLVRNDVSAEFAAVAAKLMAKDPGDRYQTPAEVAEALAPFAETESSSPSKARRAAPASAAKAGQFRKWAAAAFCLCLVGGVAAMLLLLQYARRQRVENAAAQLRSYLQTGESEQGSLNSLEILLSHADGLSHLQQLDRDFDRLLVVRGGLPDGLEFAALLLHNDRVGTNQPELSLRTGRKNFSGGSSVTLLEQLRVDALQLAPGPPKNQRVVIRYSASTQKPHRDTVEKALQLNPGAEYAVSVTLADMIRSRVDWTDVWRSGTPTGFASNNVVPSSVVMANARVAEAGIRSIEVSLQLYKVQHGRYPTMEEGLQVLAAKSGTSSGENAFVDSLLIDPWGRPYRYQVPGRRAGKPDVWSAGPDGKADTADDICSWKLPAGGAAPDRHDLACLQGRWQATYMEEGGRVVPSGLVDEVAHAFSGNTLSIVTGEKAREAKFVLNPSSTPRGIDIVADGERKRGIYELNGDTLRICWGDEHTRPTAFASDSNGGKGLLILKRTGRGTAHDKNASYYGGSLTIKSAARNADGKVEITFSTMPETVWYCPGANAASRGDGIELTFVRAWFEKRPRVDLPATAVDRNTIERVLVVNAADRPIFVREDSRRKLIWSPDSARIVGAWRVTYSEDSGRVASQEALGDMRVVFTEDAMSLKTAGRESKSAYRLDPAASPRAIDFTEDGRTKLGIYDLQGDTLRVCIAEHSGNRPTAFDSQPDSPNDLILLMKRVASENSSARSSTAGKPAAQPMVADAQAIQGRWKVTSGRHDGKDMPAEEVEDMRITFAGKRMKILAAGPGFESDFELRPARSPSEIDIVEPDRKQLGIYRLEGDSLQLCINASGIRPTKFQSEPDSSNVLMTLERERLFDEAGRALDRSGPLTTDLAKALVSEAASISNGDFRRLGSTSDPAIMLDLINNHSLSLLLLTRRPEEFEGEAAQDFQFLTAGVPKMSALAKAMRRSSDRGHVSLIQPEDILECRVGGQLPTGRVRGSVRYRKPGLYEGAVIFEAGRSDDKWRVDKLELPKLGIHIALLGDGNWRRYKVDLRTDDNVEERR